nr:immunoglobulin heavy chain junction region [Mus musculus]
CARVDWYFDVW